MRIGTNVIGTKKAEKSYEIHFLKLETQKKNSIGDISTTQ
jgi:hypothetical protein